MNGFIVDLKNQPGELARVTEAIAQKGINITAFTGATCGQSGSVLLLTNDEAGTRQALGTAQMNVREVELIPVTLADKPGALAEAARRLADAGVNIEGAVPTGMSGGNVQLALATDNPTKARAALGDRVLSGARSS